MEDEEIISLYWERNGNAVDETEKKYGSLCYSIAYRILNNEEDSRECVNDVYLRLWNLIPPERPSVLTAFIARITRNVSIDRLKYSKRKKRSGSEHDIALSELMDCIPDVSGEITDDFVIKDVINTYLERLSKENRIIFMRRYWYMQPAGKIAEDLGLTETNVRVILMRLRKGLRKMLEEEGINI